MCFVMLRADHFPPYLYMKRGTFYFSRRMTKDPLSHFCTPWIMCSIKTKKPDLAGRLARTLRPSGGKYAAVMRNLLKRRFSLNY